MNSNLNLNRIEITRPWWYRLFRSTTWFCYTYWWLIWLMFIAYIILWFMFCFRQPVGCAERQEIERKIAAITTHLDSCCNCAEINNRNQIGGINPDAKPCDYNETTSGGKGYKEIIHQLGTQPGLVQINYDMLTIPDEMSVYYNDQLVASTDRLVSGPGSLSFYYQAIPGEPTYCKIVMKAPQNGTSWNYHIGCPR